MPEYQVFHQQAVKSFSAGEDNEHQRRWTESQWEAKASNKKFNYDKSRAHLNFEIVKGGKIVPLGSSKPILERFQDRLEATGAEDPNKGLETPKYRIACNMIFRAMPTECEKWLSETKMWSERKAQTTAMSIANRR